MAAVPSIEDIQYQTLISRGINPAMARQLARLAASVERNLTGPMTTEQMNAGIQRVAQETGVQIQNTMNQTTATQNTNTNTPGAGSGTQGGRRRTRAKKGKGRPLSRRH